MVLESDSYTLEAVAAVISNVFAMAVSEINTLVRPETFFTKALISILDSDKLLKCLLSASSNSPKVFKMFDYCSWAKGRWFNHPIIEVFRREFRDRPPAYYSHACTAGLIKVNDARIEEGYRVKQGDRIQHRIHRHEPPVLNEPEPEILHVAEGLMVVSKPPSIPMHPSGRYRHNTLTSILMHRYPELFPTGHISCVNRLDRLVSGIVRK